MNDQVKQLQKEGNQLYADGRYDAARAVYTKAIALLTAGDDSSSACAPDGADTASWKSLTASQLLSNRAQTTIQERDFAAALHDATLALKHNTKNEKALLRKLVALENLERFEAALQLVNTVLDNGEKNAPTVFQYCVAARRRLRKNLAKDREVAASEVKQMGKMVHDKQQLRINFGCLLPSQVPLEQFFDVNVNIGNEFGLFRRDYVKNGEKIYLQCSLRNNNEKKFKLKFQEPLDPSDVGDAGSADANGKLTLNDRGKASFRVAVVTADASKPSNHSKPLALQVRAHESSTAPWNLFPVVSLPFTVVPPGGKLNEGITGDLGVHCCRAVSMPGLQHEILLAESPGNLGIGGKLWDSCLVLTRYLAARREVLNEKQVVELGSGLGLVGIFCSLLGARVTLTDMEEVIPLLDYNIRLNFDEADSSAKGTVLPVARAHLWGDPPRDLPLQPDVIVLSDVVYDPEGYAPLVSSLEALATAPQTLVLMAHRSRNPMEHQFFELLSQSFSCEQIDWLSTEKIAPKASAAGGPPSTEQALQDVKIFEIRRLAAQ
ncbi:lysine methyltransferase METTL21D protein [Phytophthora nicotianae]|uniref:Lysine methyltransferase METTL21D protein n=1 Tax=Phytophthora nicotianae TaxID=4792 RepID=A0A0W8CCQ7_PHYNI|nr:lysine methyltransferase METTL21D protein [Phytophthora nicotianae]